MRRRQGPSVVGASKGFPGTLDGLVRREELETGLLPLTTRGDKMEAPEESRWATDAK